MNAHVVCVCVCVCGSVYVLCVSLTGRPYAIKMHGRLLEIIHILVLTSINYRTHQKVIKTLNNVINCSMKHEMSIVVQEYDTGKQSGALVSKNNN